MITRQIISQNQQSHNRNIKSTFKEVHKIYFIAAQWPLSGAIYLSMLILLVQYLEVHTMANIRFLTSGHYDTWDIYVISTSANRRIIRQLKRNITNEWICSKNSSRMQTLHILFCSCFIFHLLFFSDTCLYFFCLFCWFLI